MTYRDILKDTIKNKIENIVDIPVLDTVVDKVFIKNKTLYPKMIFVKKLDDTVIQVIDYETYDLKGVEKPPILNNVVGLYISNATSKSEIIEYNNGILVLDKELDSMNEYIDELNIVESEQPTVSTEDYIHITSLHNFNNRKNAKLVEVFRRFEIGVFCYDDPNESKCNYYMEILRDEFDKDFTILDSKDVAYIYNPMKFDVVENGKLNRIIYGSIMLKTYK